MSENNTEDQNNKNLLDTFLSFEDIEKNNIVEVNEGDAEVIVKPPLDPSVDNTLEITDKVPEELEKDKLPDEQEKDLDISQYSYKAFLSHLNEEGLVDFEDSEDIEDKPELIFESVKNTIQKGITSYKESIPEVGKKFLDYLEKGGDPDKYIKSLDKPFDVNNINLESESDQKKVVGEYLRSQEYTEEEITETLKDYEDSLLLEKQARVASAKLNKIFDKRQEQLLQDQNLIADQQREQYSKYINDVNSTIDVSTNIAGLEISNREKEEFKKYLLAVDNQGQTQYQKELQENPIQTQLELAYLKYKKYDFGSAKKIGATETTNKLKNIFKNTETTIKTGRSSEQAEDQAGNLDAFRRFASRK
jgi:hypothetical protein